MSDPVPDLMLVLGELRAGHGGLGDSGVTPASLHSNYTQLSKKMAESWQTSRAIAKSQRPRNKETCRWARLPFLGSWREFPLFVQVRAWFSEEGKSGVSTPSQFPSGPIHTSAFLVIDGA